MKTLNKEQLEIAIRVSEEEITKLTHETLRPNAGFKMRTHGTLIAVL